MIKARILAILTCLTGCARPLASPSHEVVPVLPGVTFDTNGVPSGVPDDFSIRYEIGGCLILCPEYVLNISASGAASYAGSACVEDVGPHSSYIEPMVLLDWVTRLGALRFFEIPNRYARATEDATSSSGWYTITVGVTSGGTTAIVHDYRGYEDELPSWLTDYRAWSADVPRAFDELPAWIGDGSRDTGDGIPCRTL